MSRITWTDAASPVAVEVMSPAPVESLGFAPAAGGFIVSSPWAAIYRAAYEQALALTGPSRFQRMVEPCWN